MGAVRFTEVMHGFYGPGAPAYDAGDFTGRRVGNRISFQLTISAESVRDVVSDPLHRMQAQGQVLCKEFAATPVDVNDGDFEVFVPKSHGRFVMRYRLPFTADGVAMTLLGYKDVGDDWGPDMWSDTTTLQIRLLHGTVDWQEDADTDGEHSRGIMRLTAPMFARELLTFRGTPTGIGIFGLFFMTHLAVAYTGTNKKRRPR